MTQYLWELPEVTTVANAVLLTHRFRHRRNPQKLPQSCATPLKSGRSGDQSQVLSRTTNSNPRST
jgi:cytochrome c-type biogenesis protein CcmH/NrfF